MNIVCIGYLHGSGGAERQIIMLANEMSRRGHNVALVVLAENNVRYAIDEKVKIYDLSSCEKGNNTIIKRFLALKRCLCELKPDITVNFWLQSAYFAVCIPQKYTGKIIYSERGDPGDKEYSGLLGIIRKICFKFVDGFVFQSRGAQHYFKQNIRERSIVINNAVTGDVYKFKSPSYNRQKRIVTVGRLSEQKNQKIIINAFAEIHDKIPDYILEIWGEGNLKDELHTQIKKLNMSHKVFLKGTSRDILDKIYDASLFVLSSNYEGMPNALMEAMCIGIPCISTDCKPGGAREIICHGVSGIIVPIEDQKELAKAMLLVRDENLTRFYVSNGWNQREKFSSKIVYTIWESFLREILLR